MKRFFCKQHCDPLGGCRGHRATRELTRAAAIIAWVDGYDSLSELSDSQANDYLLAARDALVAIEAAA